MGATPSTVAFLGSNHVFIGGTVVHIGTQLATSISDKNGQIDATIKTSPQRRAIVFFANRKSAVATAMVPFLVDATEVSPPGSNMIKDVVKTHTIYIAVPELPPIPAKQAPSVPSAQTAYIDAPQVPENGQYPGQAESQPVATGSNLVAVSGQGNRCEIRDS